MYLWAAFHHVWGHMNPLPQILNPQPLNPPENEMDKEHVMGEVMTLFDDKHE